MNKNIVIKGAREHNLKNIDLTIPRAAEMDYVPWQTPSWTARGMETDGTLSGWKPGWGWNAGYYVWWEGTGSTSSHSIPRNGSQTRELFAGGSLSEEDQKAFAIEMQRIFMDSKKVAREKFTPKKYRKNAEDNGTWSSARKLVKEWHNFKPLTILKNWFRNMVPETLLSWSMRCPTQSSGRPGHSMRMVCVASLRL